MLNLIKSTSVYLELGSGATQSVFSGAAQISFSCWALADTTSNSANSSNRLFEFEIGGGTIGLVANIDGLTSSPDKKLRVMGRSRTADSLQTHNSTPSVTVGALTHFAGTWDFAADEIGSWVDGVGTVTSESFGNSSYTTAAATEADRIGTSTAASPSTTGAFDGALGELAFWLHRLTDAEVLALSRGLSPWQIGRPAFYWRMGGLEPGTAEPCLVTGLLASHIGASPTKRSEEIPMFDAFAGLGGSLTASSSQLITPHAMHLRRRMAA
jgi:hypothetical protein